MGHHDEGDRGHRRRWLRLRGGGVMQLTESARMIVMRGLDEFMSVDLHRHEGEDEGNQDRNRPRRRATALAVGPVGGACSDRWAGCSPHAGRRSGCHGLARGAPPNGALHGNRVVYKGLEGLSRAHVPLSSTPHYPVCRMPAAMPLIVSASARSSGLRATAPRARRRCSSNRTCKRLMGSTYGLRRRIELCRT